jgi:hypothetical protein
MNLHSDIQKLLSSCLEKKSISITEKQEILQKAVALNQDLKSVIIEIEKIEKSANEKNIELQKCEACGELIPALDRVCPSCKNVKSSLGRNEIKLDDLIFEGESLFSEIKALDEVVFFKRLLKNSSISFPIFIGASFVLGWNFNSDVLAGVFLCSLLLWLLVIRRLKRVSYTNNKQISTYRLLLSQLEKKMRLLELYFGNDSKTKVHLQQLKQDIIHLKKIKNSLLIYEVFLYIVAFLLLIITGYFTMI